MTFSFSLLNQSASSRTGVVWGIRRSWIKKDDQGTLKWFGCSSSLHKLKQNNLAKMNLLSSLLSSSEAMQHESNISPPNPIFSSSHDSLHRNTCQGFGLNFSTDNYSLFIGPETCHVQWANNGAFHWKSWMQYSTMDISVYPNTPPIYRLCWFKCVWHNWIYLFIRQ